MSDGKHENSETYGKARSAFDGLSMDEQATFLVESVVTMMAEGVGQAGKAVSRILDDLAEKLDDLRADEAGEKQPRPASPPKAGKKASTARKKSSGTRRPKSGTGGASGGA
jgi:hypothetical protein